MATLEQSVREYVAGFVDGDGCISLAVPTSKTRTPYPAVQLAQSYNRSHPPELKYFKSLFGGAVRMIRDATKTKRRQWQLQVHGKKEVSVMLELLASECLLKRVEAEEALEYIRGGQPEPNACAARISAMKSCYDLIDVPAAYISDAYLAGLFTAEGSVGLYQKRNQWELTACITLVNGHSLLEAIREYLGFGRVYHDRVKFAPSQTIQFLQRVRPHMQRSQKRRQVDVVLTWYSSRVAHRGKKRTQDEIDKQNHVAQKLKKLKKK